MASSVFAVFGLNATLIFLLIIIIITNAVKDMAVFTAE